MKSSLIWCENSFVVEIYFFIINSLTKMSVKGDSVSVAPLGAPSISVVKRDDITKNTYIKLYSLLNDIQDEN